MSNDEVQNGCGQVGISTKGYNALYQLLKDTLRTPGITKSSFPNPKNCNLEKEHAMMSWNIKSENSCVSMLHWS